MDLINDDRQGMEFASSEGVRQVSRFLIQQTPGRPDPTNQDAADEIIHLPDPTVTGPCQAQATFMCTGEARGEHLNPLAMLPDSTVSADYVPMCQPCKDHLSDAYVKELHS